MSKFISDNVNLSLSDVQLEFFDDWRRPGEAFKPRNSHKRSTPTMLFNNKIDLVQDVTTDCSVVASLCAATVRSELGHSDVKVDFRS